MDTEPQSDNLSPEQEKILNFLLGQVMKATKGKANPALARKLLIDKLNELS